MADPLPTAACSALRIQLLRAALDDEPAGPELQAHLATCPRCAAELSETRGILARLEAALRPEAPGSALLEHVRSRWSERPVLRPGRQPRVLRFVTTAAAAALLVVLFLPQWRSEMPSGPRIGEGPALSGQDISAIVASYAQLRWDNPLQPRLEALQAEVDALSTSVSSESTRFLPWTAEDDWDLPAETRERSERSTPDVRLVDAGTQGRPASHPSHGLV